MDTWGEAAAYAGVSCIFSHAPCMNAFEVLDETCYRVTVRAIGRAIETCGILGIPRIVVHASYSPHFTTLDFYRENQRFYRDLLKIAERYGIMILTENMTDSNLYVPLDTGRELREFVDQIDHPLFAACWDTAHANLSTKAKADGQYKCIIDIGEKLKGVHIADNFGDGAHHHTWPFAGTINFDSVMQGLLDVNYDGVFNFEASYTLLHHQNLPYARKPWVHNGKTIKTLLDPSMQLKKKAVELLYETGKYLLEAYDCFEP